MKTGDKVKLIPGGKPYIGTIEEFRPSKTAPDFMVAYVRWHKGYAQWHHASDLVLVGSAP